MFKFYNWPASKIGFYSLFICRSIIRVSYLLIPANKWEKFCKFALLHLLGRNWHPRTMWGQELKDSKL